MQKPAAQCDAEAWLHVPREVERTLLHVRGIYRNQRRAWQASVLITLSNAATLPMLRMQHCQLQRHGLMSAVAALDAATLRWARSAGTPAFSVAAWGFSQSRFTNKQLKLGDQGPSGLACTKIGLMRSAVATGLDPLLLDADVAFLRDPLPLLAPLVLEHRVAALYQSGLDAAQLAALVQRAGDTSIFRSFIYQTNSLVLNPVSRLRVCRAWPQEWPHLHNVSTSQRPHLLPDVPHGFLNGGFVWLKAGKKGLNYTSACITNLRENVRWDDQMAQQAAFCDASIFAEVDVAVISPTVVQTAAARVDANKQPPLPAVAHATFNRASNKAQKLIWLANMSGPPCLRAADLSHVARPSGSSSASSVPIISGSLPVASSISMDSSASCHPCALAKLLPRMAWRQRSGVWVLPIIPYKTGSTQWLKLLLFENTGLRVDPHRPRDWLLLLHDHDVAHQMPDDEDLMMTRLVRLIIVRNPYERMLSVYLDKLRDRKRELQLLPRSLDENSSFADFLNAVVSERPGRPHSVTGAVIGAEHYGPITTWWQLPCAPADACWLGFHNDTRVLKLELMDAWYADVIGTLGWEASASDTGWQGDCFYRPVGTDCATALQPPAPANITTTSAASADRGGGGGGCSRGRHGGHAHGGCEAMATHYTPELAALVTAFARGDLVRFGYPEWHGNVSEPWY